MHLITISNLRQDAKPYSDVQKQLKEWYDIVRTAEWQSLIGNFTIFNIKGNKYRLIVSIDYEEQLVYYKYFLTHAEYDKEQWKNGPYY
jgi:mRNA interferase HigB